ncbi:hypothetical protein GCM10010249_18890 [Streptomyces roseolilacinus]|uniref:Uncharacterized protein n=1 Tax=Streptomyces roseolilacinus TaxID=66904 RepID=A0A918AY96_9ACTN|nr:hypothetical protein GCM10010249_18890 [Streptomyces roseolilacinus]
MAGAGLPTVTAGTRPPVMRTVWGGRSWSRAPWRVLFFGEERKPRHAPEASGGDEEETLMTVLRSVHGATSGVA